MASRAASENIAAFSAKPMSPSPSATVESGQIVDTQRTQAIMDTKIPAAVLKAKSKEATKQYAFAKKFAAEQKAKSPSSPPPPPAKPKKSVKAEVRRIDKATKPAPAKVINKPAEAASTEAAAVDTPARPTPEVPLPTPEEIEAAKKKRIAEQAATREDILADYLWKTLFARFKNNLIEDAAICRLCEKNGVTRPRRMKSKELQAIHGRLRMAGVCDTLADFAVGATHAGVRFGSKMVTSSGLLMLEPPNDKLPEDFDGVFLSFSDELTQDEQLTAFLHELAYTEAIRIASHPLAFLGARLVVAARTVSRVNTELYERLLAAATEQDDADKEEIDDVLESM